MPSLASQATGGKKEKRELLNQKKKTLLKGLDDEGPKYELYPTQESPMKLIKYDFPEQPITEEEEEPPKMYRKASKASDDFEDLQIMHPPASSG